MLSRHRRLFVALLALSVMVTAALAMLQVQPPTHVVHITLGLRDREPSDWSGQVAVSGGEVVSLNGWRFEDSDAVQGTTGWKCRTRNNIAVEQRIPIQTAAGNQRPPLEQPWPNGVTLAVRGATPEVTLTLSKGGVRFLPAAVLLGEPRDFLDGQVRVERVPDTKVLRPAAPAGMMNPVQDDYPAFWVRYRPANIIWRGSPIKTSATAFSWPSAMARRDSWSDPHRGGRTRPSLPRGPRQPHDETLWIVWSSQREGNWDLYRPALQGGQARNRSAAHRRPRPRSLASHDHG